MMQTVCISATKNNSFSKKIYNNFKKSHININMMHFILNFRHSFITWNLPFNLNHNWIHILIWMIKMNKKIDSTPKFDIKTECVIMSMGLVVPWFWVFISLAIKVWGARGKKLQDDVLSLPVRPNYQPLRDTGV